MFYGPIYAISHKDHPSGYTFPPINPIHIRPTLVEIDNEPMDLTLSFEKCVFSKTSDYTFANVPFP
jgi:hypothetical protein